MSIYGQENGTGTLNVTATGTSGNAIYAEYGVNIVGCNVSATSTGATGISSGGNITISGGQVSATGGSGYDGFSTYGTLTLGWRKTTDYVYANSYWGTVKVKDGQAFKDDSGNIYVGTLDKNQINGKTLIPATQTEYIRCCLGMGNDGSAEHPYTISDANGWIAFCLALDDTNTWNGFSGKTVKLGANIAVSRMAGSDHHDFAGTFDGNRKTLTFNYTTTESTDRVAPFSYITNNTPEGSTTPSPAVIRNLNVVVNITTGGQYAGGIVGEAWSQLTIEHCTVSGTITTSNKYAGGIIGRASNTPLNITDCRSSVTIISSVEGDGTHSGIAALMPSVSNIALNITGCVFDGKLLTTNGTTNCGGFLGCNNTSDGTGATITNCLYAPAADPNTVSTGCATFGRNVNSDLITNCYYTTDFNDGEHFIGQGKQARSITSSYYVTVENAGTASSEYNTSGLTFYNEGLKYGDVLYAAASDEVSLTLGNTVPEGYFLGYSASPTEATLNGSGNPYTLTMPDADVVITANTNFPSVSYIDVNGALQQCTDYIWLTGTETTLGTAGQDTWCVVHSTLNYSQGIQLLGNTHIILCDGAAMNIGTSDSPVSGSTSQEKVGFYGSGNNLSLYAQSGNTGALTIYSQSCSFDVKDLTIAGGNVNATKISNNYPVIGCTNNLTVCRSSLEIHTNGQAVQAFNDVTLSNVTANLNSSNGVGLVCSNFTVDHSQLTVTARYQAILASNVITLGCTAATDFIKATNTSSLTGSYSGTVKIADGQTLYAGANAYTGTLTDAQRQAIGGQKLTNVAPPTYDYIGLNGTGETHTAVVIDADNMPTSLLGWYIVQGTVNYTNTIDLAGDTHIILADNAVMNVTVGGYHGIRSTSGNNYSLFVYGQTGQSGELNVTSNDYACYIYGGDITIAGGKVTASAETGIFAQYNNNGGNVTIQNATVTATASYYAIRSTNGDITIDNSNVTATRTGNGNYRAFYSEGGGNIIFRNGGKTRTEGGIYCTGDVTIEGGQVEIYGLIITNNITLGWTNPTDYIYSKSYIDMQSDPINIADNTTFIDEAGQTYSGTIAMVSGAYAIDGKTLYPNCVVRKQVEGYGEGNGGWVFIASPVAGSIAPSEVHNLFPSAGETSNEYDLYRFNQSSSNGKEWQNWKQDEGHNNVAPGFSLVNGHGYLYATKETRTLVFAGEYTAATGSVEVPLDYDATAQLKGWNLVGNPFTTQATMTDRNGQPVSFYVINGQNVVPYEGSAAIEPCTGVMVKAEGTGEKVRFTSVSPDQAPQPNKGSLQIALSQVTSSLRGTKQSSTLDNAIISFNEGSKLGKFYFGTQNANIYIPQGNEEYAIAFSEGQGEMPLNFKAKENGTYTLTVSTTLNSKLSTLNYLHLIDNLTGADVDLLTPPACGHPLSEGEARSGAELGSNRPATDSRTPAGVPPLQRGQGGFNYTFTAKTTDYESRFKLVFSICEDASGDNETFAFIDASGNLIVNGEGTLQVFDILGHQLFTKQLSTLNSQLSTLNYTPGIYVLRLIDREKVRTQKIVIE